VITTLLIDGHVHYHPGFGVARFLEAAVSNFRAARDEVGQQNAVGCLMFTESSWSHYFRAFANGLIEREASDWSVETTDEECSLVACKDRDERLLLVAGRQIVTAERLEVLALATTDEYPDGLAIHEAVERTLSSGAVTVLPWGFGKWTAGRGRMIRDILVSPSADEIFVGDNGGRPALAPRPALFRLAEARGIPILPGSDPLPLPAEVGRPGRYGFVLQGPVDPQAPATAIRTMLATRSQPRRFGRLERFATFVQRQAALRLRRGQRGRSADVHDAE
jgi:hypothetical protein